MGERIAYDEGTLGQPKLVKDHFACRAACGRGCGGFNYAKEDTDIQLFPSNYILKIRKGTCQLLKPKGLMDTYLGLFQVNSWIQGQNPLHYKYVQHPATISSSTTCQISDGKSYRLAKSVPLNLHLHRLMTGPGLKYCNQSTHHNVPLKSS